MLLILCFIIELVVYEKVEYEVVVMFVLFECSLFGEGLLVCVLMCEVDGELVGFVVYFFLYLMWFVW